MIQVFIASDHAGFKMKEELLLQLREQLPAYTFLNLGTHDEHQSVDYPDYAQLVCCEVLSDPNHLNVGILICGTGIGMSIMANKYQGIRAALCKSSDEGHLAKEHNNANVLCLGARTTTLETNLEIVKSWLKTSFSVGRHQRRVDKLNQLGSPLV